MFAGKTAIVSGAGSGIGRAIVHMMAEKNANIVSVGRNLRSLEKVSKEIDSIGNGRVYIQKADVSNSKEVNKVVENVLLEFGKIDILINNAAIAGPTFSFTELTEEDWDNVIKNNLKSVFLFSKAVIIHMIERKYGKIVNFSSIAAKEGNPNLAAYVASKAGVIGLSRSLALGVAKMGINVNCICPAVTETPMMRSLGKEQIQELKNKTPQGRFCKPEEQAAAVCFLASDEASFITGQCINVSGGRGYF
jgi:3-oxoacyl-[acyl-carrier protein] reductase